LRIYNPISVFYARNRMRIYQDTSEEKEYGDENINETPCALQAAACTQHAGANTPFPEDLDRDAGPVCEKAALYGLYHCLV
jgi:hypothetical protein